MSISSLPVKVLHIAVAACRSGWNNRRRESRPQISTMAILRGPLLNLENPKAPSCKKQTLVLEWFTGPDGLSDSPRGSGLVVPSSWNLLPDIGRKEAKADLVSPRGRKETEGETDQSLGTDRSHRQ